ncbi:unnamed protein product, partial [Mesorhabditis spiculigera]
MAEKRLSVLDFKLGNKGFAVGVDVKDSKVTKVYPSSAFLGHLFVNDCLKNVNGKVITNTAEFYQVISANSPGKVLIEYERDEAVKVTVKQVPGGRPGFELHEMELVWYSGGSILGLLVTKDAEGHVVVAMIEDGSVVAKQVEAGDILVKVNDQAVTEKDAARLLIHNGVNKNKKVKLLLERAKKEYPVPNSPCSEMKSNEMKSIKSPDPAGPSKSDTTLKSQMPSAIVVVKSKETASTYTPTTIGVVTSKYTPPAVLPLPPGWKPAAGADPPLPPDVIEVMAANKEFFKIACAEPSMIRTASVPNAPHVVEASLTEKVPEVEIGFDPSPKPLKKTPKRVGS